MVDAVEAISRKLGVQNAVIAQKARELCRLSLIKLPSLGKVRIGGHSRKGDAMLAALAWPRCMRPLLDA